MVYFNSRRVARHVGHTGMPVTELSHDRHFDYYDITETETRKRSNIPKLSSLYHCHLKSQTLDSKLGLPILMISYVT